MGANYNGRNSQMLPFEPDLVEFLNRYRDFTVALENSVSDERTIQFTKVLASDEGLVTKRAEEQAVKFFIVESILPNLPERYANVIQYFIRLSEENSESLEDIGNTVMFDHVTVQNTEDKDK